MFVMWVIVGNGVDDWPDDLGPPKTKRIGWDRVFGIRNHTQHACRGTHKVIGTWEIIFGCETQIILLYIFRYY